MFLTPDELRELTGLRRPSSICQWLDNEGIRYIVGRDKWPRVLRSVILVRLGNVTQSSNEPRLHLA